MASVPHLVASLSVRQQPSALRAKGERIVLTVPVFVFDWLVAQTARKQLLAGGWLTAF